MRPFDDLFMFCLRIGELAFAAVVCGLTGEYLHSVNNENNSDWSKARFIYTETVAAFSILVALIFLIPRAGSFIHWPLDLLLFVAWIVAFGLMVNFIGPLNCGSVFYWGDITQNGTCQKWKADVAFAFLSAIFWLASALLGIWYIHRARSGKHTTAGNGVGSNAAYGRRRWFRSHRV